MRIESREFLPKQQVSVHASSICFHPNGHPVFSWFEGPREGHPHVFIRLYNLHGDGQSILIGDKDFMPRWNPILFSHNNRIGLFHKVGEFCDRWQTLYSDVTNWRNDITNKEIMDGVIILPAGLNGCVKTKPMFNDDGLLMYCGSSTETIMDWTSYVECYSIDEFGIYPIWRSNAITVEEKVTYRNPYNGVTSKSLGIIQPALWRSGNKMCSFFRSSYGLGNVFYSETEDTDFQKFSLWEPPTAIDIPNPNSSVDVVQYGDRLFLACNPVKTGRLPLVVFELDKDLKPIDTLVVTTEIEGNALSQEASYPYMVEKEGKLHLVYTYGRSKIEYVQIAID